MANPTETKNMQAVAQEVIVSAGNILVAAGYNRHEIAEFFRQAADHLAPQARQMTMPQPFGADIPARPPGSVPVARSIKAMQDGFAEIAPIRALAEMAVGAGVVAALQDGSAPARRHLDPALPMLPLLAEAQNWLSDKAQQSGLSVVADRQHWLAEAAPEALAQVERMLFLSDFAPAYQPCFDFITALAAAVVRENDEAALTVLLRGLAGHGIIVTYDLKVLLETATQKLVPVTMAAV